MNTYSISNPTEGDTEAGESDANVHGMPYRELGRRLTLMGQVGRGTSFFLDEINQMAREGRYVGYYVTGEHGHDALLVTNALLVTISGLGQETLLDLKAAAVLPLLAAQSEAASIGAHALVPGVRIARQPPQVNLGAIPTVVDTDAENLLAQLPGNAVPLVVRAVRDWVVDHADVVTRARVLSVIEPEDIGWAEVVIELRVEADTQTAMRLWDELASRLDEAKEVLSDGERAIVNSTLGVHLVWDEDDEDEV